MPKTRKEKARALCSVSSWMLSRASRCPTGEGRSLYLSTAVVPLAIAALILRGKKLRGIKLRDKEQVHKLNKLDGNINDAETASQSHRKRPYSTSGVLRRELSLMDTEGYFTYFRMTQQRFDKLHSLVGLAIRKLNTSWRDAVSSQERLALTLRYLAQGEAMITLSRNYSLGKSTVSNIVRDTCQALWNVLQDLYLKIPDTEQWIEIAEDFESTSGFPNCVGAVGGKQVVLDSRSTPTIVVLASCDAHYRFTLVDFYCADESQNDGGIFENSTFNYAVTNNSINLPSEKALPGTEVNAPYVFVGDATFPLQSSFLFPYPGTDLPYKNGIFNHRLSQVQHINENAFGILASRWRIYHKPLTASSSTANAIVKATIALHNFLVTCDLEDGDTTATGCYLPQGFADFRSSDGVIHEGQWRQLVSAQCSLQSPKNIECPMYSPTGSAQVRETFADYFCSIEGQVLLPHSVI